jgi:hypothetical protein
MKAISQQLLQAFLSGESTESLTLYYPTSGVSVIRIPDYRVGRKVYKSHLRYFYPNIEWDHRQAWVEWQLRKAIVEQQQATPRRGRHE